MSADRPAGLLGLDRKQMEAERLARLARKRNAGESDQEPPAKRVKAALRSETRLLRDDDHDVEVAGAKDAKGSFRNAIIQDDDDGKGAAVKDDRRQALSPKAQASRQSPPLKPQSASIISSTNPTTSTFQQPHGALLKTWAFSHPRATDIKIEEILQKHTLNIAVISSWQWDFDWLMSKFSPGRTKFVFCMEAKTDADKTDWRSQFEGINSVRLVFPSMTRSAYGRMHSKLMLLFHETYLRVVVPSANPTRHDWGEDGRLENMVFVIDLPRLPAGITSSETPFLMSLRTFLTAQSFPSDVLEGLAKFDFSTTRDIAFVHSMAGNYAGDEVFTTGLPRLSGTVQKLGVTPASSAQARIHFATSSLGSLDATQISSFTHALRGLDPFESLSSASAPATTSTTHLDDETASEASTSSEHNGTNPQDTFAIVFPSHKTVVSSKGGTDAAGTIFLPRKTFNNPSFPKELMHDYQSTRPGLLSHNKLILTRFSRSRRMPGVLDEPKVEDEGHLYIGSANLSASAWGRLSIGKQGRGKNAKEIRKMNVANWECGVLLPATFPVSAVGADQAAEGVIKVLGTEMKMPFVMPARKYEKDEMPWMQDGF